MTTDLEADLHVEGQARDLPRKWPVYSPAMSSLIQQRMAIERIRTSAIAWTLFGGVGALLAIAQLVVGTDPTRAAVYFGVAGGMIIVGLVRGDTVGQSRRSPPRTA